MTPVRRPLAKFTLSTLLVVLLVLATTVTGAVLAARAEAEQDAHRMAEYFAGTVASPLRVGDLEGGDEHRALLDDSVEEFLSTGNAYRVKLWTLEEDDTVEIVYSDLPEIEGLRVPISPILDEALSSRRPVMVPVPPDAPHRTEQREGVDTVEVYLPYEDASGALAVAELYLEVDTDARTREILEQALPVAVGGPALLAVLTFPLALRLARSYRRIEAGRRELTEEALAVSETERRRLARLLHDGPIQALTALGMALERRGHRRTGDPFGNGEDTAAIADEVRGQVSRLRDLLDELDPVDVDAGDLHASLLRVVESIPGHATRVEVTGSPLSGTAADVRTLIRRAATELIRNALLHSRAGTVTVHLAEGPEDVSVLVRDDGVGFDPSEPRLGHHGLHLVRSAVDAADGAFDLTTGATGTTVRIDLPRHR